MANRAPTTKEIANNLMASFENAFGKAVSTLSKSFLYVTSKVMAGVYVILYKYAGFLGLQMFIRYASTEATEINGKTVIPLIELGVQLGVGLPMQATAAELNVEITVNNQGSFIPAGTQLLGEKNGVTYITVGSTSLNAATVTALILAVDDQSGGNGAGVIGNLDVGDTVSFINPLAEVAQATVVSSVAQTGANGEDLNTAYRQRVLDRRQKPPQGGAYADYEIWGEIPAGILNVYPYAGSPGVVNTYSEATVESSGSADGIPTDDQLEEVYNSIQKNGDTGRASRRPIGAFVNSYPITRSVFGVVIGGLDIDGDSGLIKAEISAALTQYFWDREPFIDGLSILPRRDRVTQSAVGGIVEEVINNFGGIFEYAELVYGGSNTAIVTLNEGQKAKLGEVTYV